MSYKIQNRSVDPARVRIVKNGNGTLTFAGDPTPTYQENTIQAGFCLSPIDSIPELQKPLTTMELTASPIGLNGRVSIFRNGTLTTTMRYSNLASITDKVNWFNGHFGAVVSLSITNGIATFTILEDVNSLMVVFEDDDIDFLFNAVEPVNPNKTAFFVEQYRLAIGIKKLDISCAGASDFTGLLTVDNWTGGALMTADGGITQPATEDELLDQIRALGLIVVEMPDEGL